MTQSELAQRLGRPLKTVNEIIKGKAAITAETAIQLERALGISASFWTNLETQYRDALARQEATNELEGHVGWLDRFPVKEMVRRRLIDRGSTDSETLDNLLSWLGIASPAAFDKMSEAVAYRRSTAFKTSPEAVAVWLRLGELQATTVKANAFDLARFRTTMAAIRPLTRKEPVSQVLGRVQEMCAEVGVVVTLTPELPGTHLSGATRWIGSRALIQLSLRHKTDDDLWFTFFHEGGHICSGSRRHEAIDGPWTHQQTDPDELAADLWARETLLGQSQYLAFIAARDFSSSTVRRFAEDRGIAPGVVAGFLEREGLVVHGRLRHLKKSVAYAAGP
jgi:addiction module HigA family antidote